MKGSPIDCGRGTFNSQCCLNLMRAGETNQSNPKMASVRSSPNLQTLVKAAVTCIVIAFLRFEVSVLSSQGPPAELPLRQIVDSWWSNDLSFLAAHLPIV